MGQGRVVTEAVAYADPGILPHGRLRHCGLDSLGILLLQIDPFRIVFIAAGIRRAFFVIAPCGLLRLMGDLLLCARQRLAQDVADRIVDDPPCIGQEGRIRAG